MVESGNPKASGWLSSIIAIIMALLLLHAFPVMGNWIDNQRAGEGKYEFDEEMCFDITSKKDFKDGGIGALAYSYTITGDVIKTNSDNDIITMSVPLNGTVNGYGVGVCNPTPPDVPIPPVTKFNAIFITLNFTKSKIIDLDITAIDIYLNIAGVSFSKMPTATLTDEAVTNTINLLGVNVGNITHYKIDVFDLLEINTLSDTGKIKFAFNTVSLGTTGFIPAGSPVVFDMQFYCIKERKAPTITSLAGWLSLMNIGVLIMVFIALPEVQILGRFNRVGERLKKI